jgi:hypothetical protein
VCVELFSFFFFLSFLVVVVKYTQCKILIFGAVGVAQ